MLLYKHVHNISHVLAPVRETSLRVSEWGTFEDMPIVYICLGYRICECTVLKQLHRIESLKVMMREISQQTHSAT
jgi:hypothetical protein